MILKEKLLNYNDVTPGDVYIFTANSMVNKIGALCMGGGAALAALQANPGVDSLLGIEINKKVFNGVFGYIQVPYNFIEVGAFQTKTVVWKPSTLNLIEIATCELNKIATNCTKTYHLNFPGIGLGGLDPDDVAPIIQILPDNVIVYK